MTQVGPDDEQQIGQEPANDNGSWDESIEYPSPSVSNLRLSTLRRRYSPTCCLNIVLIGALILTVSLVIYFATRNYFTSTNNLQFPLSVMTFCGGLRGFHSPEGLTTFLGIPYALPPTESRRFKHPVELTASELCQQHWAANTTSTQASPSVRSALDAKPPCVQYVPKSNEDLVGNEDCLYLNIFIPPNTNSDQPKPVVVLINGLFFAYDGMNSSHLLSPETVKQVDAVHVTLHYRLGAFGFLVHPDVKQANAGIYDQLAALRWIRQNIAKFGGDPSRVSLFGYGSGSSTVLALAYSELGRNLFDRVWMSAPALSQPLTSIDNAITSARSQLNCSEPDLTCDRPQDLTVDEIMRDWRWSELESRLKEHMFGLPTADDLTSLSQPAWHDPLTNLFVIDNDLIEPDGWHQLNYFLPIVFGQTSRETAVYLTPNTAGLWDNTTYTSFLTKHLTAPVGETPISIDGVLSSHGLASTCEATEPEPFDIEAHLSVLSTDARLTCPLLRVANRLVNSVHPVYHYYLHQSHRRFDPYALQSFGSLGFHGWDGLLYLRGYTTHADYHFSTGDSAGETDSSELIRVSDTLNRAMHEFAHNGVIKHWKRADPSSLIVNIIDRTGLCQASDNFLQLRCGIWDQLTGGDASRLAWKL